MQQVRWDTHQGTQEPIMAPLVDSREELVTSWSPLLVVVSSPYLELMSGLSFQLPH